MSVRIMALSQHPLEEDYHYYAEFLKEVVERVLLSDTPVTASEGRLANGLYYKAMKLEFDDISAIERSVWVSVPELDFDKWLQMVEGDSATQGVFSINTAHPTLRLSDVGFCYESIMDFELFDLFLKEENDGK